MKKAFLLFVTVFAIVLCISGCEEKRYAQEEIIGLSSAEIVAKFGDFDRTQGEPDNRGLYRDCACGYLISEAKAGFFGTTPPEYFMIYFDENGIADFCRQEQIV